MGSASQREEGSFFHSLNLISRAKIKRYPGNTVMSVKNMPPERDCEVSAD